MKIFVTLQWCQASCVLSFGQISDCEFSCCDGPPAVCENGVAYCERTITRRLMKSLIETKAAKLFTQGHATLARFYLCVRRFWTGLEEEEGERRKTPDLQWRGQKDDDLAKRKGWTKLLYGIIAGASEIESLCTEENINRAVVGKPFEADVLELFMDK